MESLEDSEEANTLQICSALFHTSNNDLRMALHSDDFVCLSDDDGFKHIDKSKYAGKDKGTRGFEESDVKSLLLLNRVLRVGIDQTGQYMDIQSDLRHAPLIINESRCNARQVGDGRKSSILKSEDATRYRSMCLRLSYLTQDGLDLAETAKHLAHQKREPRAFDFIPMKRVARYLVVKSRSALRYRRQGTR